MRQRLTAAGQGGSFQGDVNLQYLKWGNAYTAATFMKTHRTICLQGIHFIEWKLYLNKVNMEKQKQKTKQLLYDPATTILGIYPRKMKTYVYTKTCTWMLIGDVHAIIKNCSQFRCPLIGESLNKLWYSHTMEYYSARKRNELLICTAWMNFQRIMLGKSQFKEYTLYSSIYITSLK